ncbi:MAG: hypothetical protein K6T81_13300 [Alicyclobacillus macrosporangiidus]|uniref:hypothetical protein n=1 Tax=Alicyclobacillus macrosporangiidus TaxID=392015 RepID=UPI0026EBD92F|nr:hypothetical protein [Alicyclobacillus macrosporangiidus]MCL6599698.1 hypothetical protein [Alicyclobacillus macrosporangiidus]
MKKHTRLIVTTLLGLLVTGCGVANNNATSNKSSTNSIPNEVNIIQRIDPKTTVGNHHFDGAVSIWRDGSWSDHKTGLVGPRFVISFMGTSKNGVVTYPDQPFIEVYNEDETPYVSGVEWVHYPCPRNIGRLTITGITNDGTLVHFVSSQGVQGTLDLTTHQWRFST